MKKIYIQTILSGMAFFTFLAIFTLFLIPLPYALAVMEHEFSFVVGMVICWILINRK